MTITPDQAALIVDVLEGNAAEFYEYRDFDATARAARRRIWRRIEELGHAPGSERQARAEWLREHLEGVT